MKNVFLQTFTGDVTIHMPFGLDLLWAYRKFISDPSRKDMERYFELGQKFTWPKLYMIQNHMMLEKILVEKYDQLLKQKGTINID